MTKRRKLKSGFIGLVAIILITTISTMIGATIMLRSITEATTSLDEERSAKAWGAVNACAEVALLNMASSTNLASSWDYPGEESVSVGDHDCYILDTVGIGTGTSTPRTIRASSTVDSFVRKLEIELETNDPDIVITSWTEVADFSD